MDNNLLKTVEQLKSVEWPTKVGGVTYAFGIFVLSSGVIFVLSRVGVLIGARWIIGALLVFQVIHIIAWLINRSYFYDPNFLTVAFAIKTEESSKDYYREIKKKFREQINTYKLQSDIKIKEFPGDVSFSDENLAEEFIVKKGIGLLVWGNTTEGNVEGAPFTQFNLKLSYQYRAPNNKEKHGKFLDEMEVATQRKVWGIKMPNSFHHLIVVSENVLEVSLYTLGACLATVPNVHYLLKSLDIFEKLQDILKEQKQDANFPNLCFVKERVRSFLCEAYTFLLVYYWGYDRNLDKSIEYAEKALKIDENNFTAHQNMAVFQWRKGEKDLARFHTERARRIKPGHSLPMFNRAFFFIYDGNYEQGLRQYRKIKYAGDTNMIDVVRFVEDEFEKSAGNLGLLFTAGWLNFHYVDQIVGITQLQDFLTQAEENPIYKVLVKEVEKVISLRTS